ARSAAARTVNWLASICSSASGSSRLPRGRRRAAGFVVVARPLARGESSAPAPVKAPPKPTQTRSDSGGGKPAALVGAAASKAPSTTGALVPPKPKPLIAARRVSPARRGQG